MDFADLPELSLAAMTVGFATTARLQGLSSGYRRVVQQHLTAPASPPP
ncbi:hypothetical protein [Devosia sp. A16]|nr:hypothetical protein [Devosia sp. A16]